jgi:activator of 2-hydroxyglutaryl-CoA dehydratase/predicted nucleotide-binding protein (sugar kinase/HSP70/actin superfamily)
MPDTRRLQGAAWFREGLVIGLDVGSTTVKAVVADPATNAVLWTDYRRHETRQQETCLDFLVRIEAAFPRVPRTGVRVFTTGAGGAAVSEYIGARFVQEVHAVCLAVEKRHPQARSVIEIGGEDAKIVILSVDPKTGARKRTASMNDKCAGGTGAIIDKISAKLGIASDQLGATRYEGVRIHPVAGKCGVFAETDVTGLQKQGLPPEELMASLFEAVVRQNLTALARGNALHPPVLLLGGPHAFIPGMRECWRYHLPRVWRERNVPVPQDTSLDDLVFVPEDAVLFAALGAVEFGKTELAEDTEAGRYRGTDRLRRRLAAGPVQQRSASAVGRGPGVVRTAELGGLVKNAAELRAFLDAYDPEVWVPPARDRGAAIEAFLGVDGGSTSTKAVLIDADKRVLAKAYRLSAGNPIEDAQRVIADLRGQLAAQGCRVRVLGAATTGYAREILQEVIGADVALVETVAHMHSGLDEHPQADVICDVGGQDIKIIILKNGAVKDFRLNTQCSAGNGYYLQATAAALGYRVEDYADVAFTARAMPEFGFGCAVFLQSDIVDCQRRGWRPNEILAGLAAVLPKNIWLYVCQMPNLARLGTTFLLQGGVQRNRAAVKAQVDFIRARFDGTAIVPHIQVHKHCGEAGAIGCAIEARRRYLERPYRTAFIGFQTLQALRYSTRRDESTRCPACANQCPRTFIDLRTDSRGTDVGPAFRSRRIVIANCEKGAAQDAHDLRAAARRITAVRQANPDLVAASAREVFQPVAVAHVGDPLPRSAGSVWPGKRRALRRRRALLIERSRVRLGLPRVLNLYALAPFFLGYFTSLGIRPENIVWSDYSSERLYREGATRGSIDPCYPSKLALAHIHNLLYRQHAAASLTHIFLPAIDAFPTWLDRVQATRACPAGAATGEAAYAAFVKEGDLFTEHGIRFKRTFVDLSDATLCAHQMYEDWTDEIGLSMGESLRAAREGFKALERYLSDRRKEGRDILMTVERERRLALVVLARPYHNDPGVNHAVCAEFQKRGYPILTVESLPIDADILEALFGAEIRAGHMRSALGIDDVWKNTFAENTSRKLWAAKFVARHPNLVALELSSFKCGCDAPTYTAVEEIVECGGKPFFYLRDLDENQPHGSIRMRVDTMAYFLEQYQESLRRRPDGIEVAISPWVSHDFNRWDSACPIGEAEALKPTAVA